MAIPSFKDARYNFAQNLSTLLQQLHYTPSILCMKLNAEAIKPYLSSAEVSDWTEGKKLPSLYALFKLSHYLNVPIDAMLNSKKLDATALKAKSFAAQTEASPKIVASEVAVMCSEPVIDVKRVEVKQTYKPANPNRVSPKATFIKKPNIALVKSRTTSDKYNPLLATKVLLSQRQIKEIAKDLGVSPRSLRDYMYYGTTIPENVGKNMLKVLRASNYTSIGIKLNTETKRFIHI